MTEGKHGGGRGGGRGGSPGNQASRPGRQGTPAVSLSHPERRGGKPVVTVESRLTFSSCCHLSVVGSRAAVMSSLTTWEPATCLDGVVVCQARRLTGFNCILMKNYNQGKMTDKVKTTAD